MLSISRFLLKRLIDLLRLKTCTVIFRFIYFTFSFSVRGERWYDGTVVLLFVYTEDRGSSHRCCFRTILALTILLIASVITIDLSAKEIKYLYPSERSKTKGEIRSHSCRGREYGKRQAGRLIL